MATAGTHARDRRTPVRAVVAGAVLALALVALAAAPPAVASTQPNTRPATTGRTRAEMRGATTSATVTAARLPLARTISGRYIVELVGGADIREVARDHRGAVRVGRRFADALPGFVARTDAAGAADLRADPRVAAVEADQAVRLQETQADASWGLDRLDQRAGRRDHTYTYDRSGALGSTGRGVHAYVIDSGVYAGHRDFEGRVLSGFDALGRGSTRDCNGHGSHVAGTIAGHRWGVAKAVRVIPVRIGCSVIDKSDLLSGLDFVVRHHRRSRPAVANLSLSGPASPMVDRAIRRVLDDRVTVVVAAGNEGIDACLTSPSRVGGALTVGATGKTDIIAKFSNYGPCIDLFAPGVGITSASSSARAGTRTMDGTSMSAPHVAGVAARYLSDHPRALPSTVAAAIKRSASRGVLAGHWGGDPDRLLFAPGRTPTRLALSVSDGRVGVGEGVTVEGVLTNAISGTPLRDHAVTLRRRTLGDADWRWLATKTTNRDGVIRVNLSAVAALDLQLRHFASPETAGQLSPVRRVDVVCAPLPGLC